MAKILLHDSKTNYPMLVDNDLIGLVEKSNDEKGKSFVYFKYPLSDGTSEYKMIIVNETVEKISKLLA